MTLADLLDYTRKHVLRDTGKPPLFPDDLVIKFLNEGLRKIATRTHMLVTATEELDLSANEAFYDLDPGVVFVYGVRLDGYTGYLADCTESVVPNYELVSRPTAFTTDGETQSIRFFATPDQDYTAILRVAKLPSVLSEDDLEAEVEIKQQYELLPAEWAGYRCMSLPDADGFAPGVAEVAKRKFLEGVSDIKFDEFRLKTGHNQRVHGRRVK